MFISKLEEAKRRRNQRRKIKENTQKEIVNNIIEKNEIDIEKFNKYKWPKPIEREKILSLYISDAKGFKDIDLVDDIGFAFYARCLYGRENRDCVIKNKIKCHNCGIVLSVDTYGIALCSCRHSYTLSEYKSSFTKNKMPNGNAIVIFDEFEKKWPLAKNYDQKMRLIDWIIHEVHCNIENGMYGRIVGMQLIEGTSHEIKDLILLLANENTNDSEHTKRFKYLISGLQ